MQAKEGGQAALIMGAIQTAVEGGNSDKEEGKNYLNGNLTMVKWDRPPHFHFPLPQTNGCKDLNIFLFLSNMGMSLYQGRKEKWIRIRDLGPKRSYYK